MSPGFTAAEKILARVSGRPGVRAGEEVDARPDFVLAYVFGGFARFHRMVHDDFGLERLDDASRFALFLDHNIPVTDAKLEARVGEIRRWCEAQGVAVHDGEGIGHVVASEQGYASPGSFAVHFDGHVSQLGAFGALAVGVHTGLYEAFARGRVHLVVPPTVRVTFTGVRRPGVMARDVLHHLIARFGADFANGAVLELAGPGLDTLSLDDLQTLCGLAMFTGAVTAFVAPRADALAFASAHARRSPEPVASDPDAAFAADLACDLGDVRLLIAAPPSPAAVTPLEAVLGTPVDVGYIGSCVSGRIEDLRAATAVLSGRRVKSGFVLNVVPSSRQVMVQAAREGLVAALAEAGAFVSSPTCSYCYGAVGALHAGQTAISTGTLNIPGRMGSSEARIYLGNAAVAAAAAAAGRLIDPREYL